MKTWLIVMLVVATVGAVTLGIIAHRRNKSAQNSLQGSQTLPKSLPNPNGKSPTTEGKTMMQNATDVVQKVLNPGG